jgi:hypothetical protein
VKPRSNDLELKALPVRLIQSLENLNSQAIDTDSGMLVPNQARFAPPPTVGSGYGDLVLVRHKLSEIVRYLLDLVRHQLYKTVRQT